MAVAKDLLDNRRKGGTAWAEQLATAPLEFQPGHALGLQSACALMCWVASYEIASGQRYADFLQQRLFAPLRMTDISFWATDALRARVVTNYVMTPKGIEPNSDPEQFSSATLDSGAAGLYATAESYARFAMMLANGGELDGVRVLSPASVALMGSRIIPDTLPGRQPGEGWGLGVRTITDSALRHTLVATGSFGWSGAYGTHFWVDPRTKLVAIIDGADPGSVAAPGTSNGRDAGRTALGPRP
jgi:CubicO group peptidase (beta-lactamase class C family)